MKYDCFPEIAAEFRLLPARGESVLAEETNRRAVLRFIPDVLCQCRVNSGAQSCGAGDNFFSCTKLKDLRPRACPLPSSPARRVDTARARGKTEKNDRGGPRYYRISTKGS